MQQPADLDIWTGALLVSPSARQTTRHFLEADSPVVQLPKVHMVLRHSVYAWSSLLLLLLSGRFSREIDVHTWCTTKGDRVPVDQCRCQWPSVFLGNPIVLE